MIYVPVSQLESGMVLAAPVRHPVVPEHVLLHADYTLDADTIGRLGGQAVKGVWIRHPGLKSRCAGMRGAAYLHVVFDAMIHLYSQLLSEAVLGASPYRMKFEAFARS